MLAWPLRPPTVAWLGGMVVASVLVQLLAVLSPVLGLALSAAWWVMAFKLASEALTTVADGRDGDAAFVANAGDGVAFRQLMLGVGLIVLGGACWQFGGQGARIAFGLAVALLLPAVIVVLVMEDSVVSALDPRNWLLLLRGVGADYGVVAGKIAVLALAVGFALALAAALPPWLGAAVSHGLVLYLMLAAYRALGMLLDAHRDALEGLAEAEEPPPRHDDVATPEERVAVAEASRLQALEQPAAAAAVLERLIRGRGATAPVHARYRALLHMQGDGEALQRHAQVHVATLLHLGKPREALALYLDARGRDPAFELAEPQEVSELIALAARNQQAQLAVTLAEEFARRFPRDRDVVVNGLTAARLMTDRLGRDAEAAVLLRRLLAGHPEHPLRPDLESALLAIPLPR